MRKLTLGVFGIALLVGCSATQDVETEAAEQPVSEEKEAVVDEQAEAERDLSGEGASLPEGMDEPLSVKAGTCTVTVDPNRELIIRALGVVNDPVRTRNGGAWTFGRLMTDMAGANDPKVFVRNWLSRWEADRTINGFVVPARPEIKQRVIDGWPKDATGKLDLTKAPMRLLAITNRIDLRNLAAGNAGEGRFVFGVTDPDGAPMQFTVILEYKLPATTAADVRAWADQWHALGTLTIGSAAYNDALQKITDRFAGRNAAPTKINGSSIGQVRTNEIALRGPWELREFRLNTSGQLAQGTVAQTPDLSLNGQARFARFVNANEAKILAGQHVIPTTFESLPFRGGNAPTDFSTAWRATGITNNQARHLVSLNTCNGCHGGETQTSFLHIFPRTATSVAGLSTFLTGKTVTDPVTGQSRTFNDLARRRTDLRNLLCQ